MLGTLKTSRCDDVFPLTSGDSQGTADVAETYHPTGVRDKCVDQARGHKPQLRNRGQVYTNREWAMGNCRGCVEDCLEQRTR